MRKTPSGPSDSTDPAYVPGQWLSWFAIVAAIFLIGVATLTPQESVNAHNDLRIFKGWNRSHVREDLLNLALFVPLGAGTAAARFSLRHMLAIATGVSTLVELLQWSGVVHGRFAELQDLLSNVSGALLGFGMVAALRRLRRTSVIQ